MQKLLAAAALSGVLLLGASPAYATSTSGDHNCAGTSSSSLATALDPPTFGTTVAYLAPVNDLGLANCGATP